jgi:hypothetical protein
MNSIEALLDLKVIRLSLSDNKDEGIMEIGMQGNGCGIPANMQNRFSQPFCSSKINNKNAWLSFSIYQQVLYEYGRPFSLLDVPVVHGTLPEAARARSPMIPRFLPAVRRQEYCGKEGDRSRTREPSGQRIGAVLPKGLKHGQ